VNYQKLTDKQLMELIATGDEQAFEEIYGRYEIDLYSFIRWRCADTQVVDDIFQDTWKTVFQSARSYTDSGNFKAWLLRIAGSRLNDHFRKRPKNDNTEEYDPEIVGNDTLSIEDLVDLLNETDKLFTCMRDCLPPAQAEALSLYLTGISITEITEITGVIKETAKSRVRYAIAKLIRKFQSRQ
jgi:RNA polymerase sigma-70 factor (ECF subfamily)